MENATVLPHWLMNWFEDMYCPDNMTVEELSRNPYANPGAAETLRGLPPTTGVISGADILRDEGVAFLRRLASEGVPVEWRQWDHAFHGFFQMPCNSLATNAQDYVVDQLRKYS
jgi:acetyl esterase